MKTKKLWWFVAIAYADSDVDIAKSDDYNKAVLMANKVWSDAVEEWRKTKIEAILSVELFDGQGRILWTSLDEPGGMQKSTYFAHMAEGLGPA